MAGATINVTDSHTRIVSTRSDESGAYRVTLEVGDSLFIVSVSMLGYAPQERIVRLEAGKPPTLTADFSLMRTVQALDEIRTVARRPRSPRDEHGVIRTPGENREALDQSSGLSGDVSGSLAAALALVPGIVSTPGANGLSTSGAFGFGPESNGTTLNGTDFQGAALPRDGLRLGVRTATYDPKFGGAAGVQVAASMTCGCLYFTRTVRLSVAEPALQWNAGDQPSLAAGSRNRIASGTVADVIVADRSYYNVAYQVSRQTAESPTVYSLAPAGLTSLDISPDSVERLRAITSSVRLPVGAPNLSRTSITSASVVARVDLSNAPLQNMRLETLQHPMLYVLASGATSQSRGIGVGPTGSTLQASRRDRSDGQLVLAFAPYLFDVLSETKASLSWSQTRTAPELKLPGAAVQLLSTLESTAVGATVLHIGGSAVSEASERKATLQLTNETLWMSRGGAHRFQVYGDLSVTRFSAQDTPNAYGQFVFNSLDEFEAGRPSSFARSFGGRSGNGTVMQGVLGISDIVRSADAARITPFAPPAGLTVQYGARLEFQQFDRTSELNPLVLTTLDRRTDVVPNSMALSPMLGLTWAKGTFREDMSSGGFFSSERHLLTAGVRRYRGTLSPLSAYQVGQQSGLPSSMQTVRCLGSAAPSPQWNMYAGDPGAIPTLCVDGSNASLVQSAPNVALFSPSYEPPTGWRAEANWRTRYSGRLFIVTGATYALNLGGVERHDVNFDERPKLSLPSELSRPVYVPPSSIDPSSGYFSTSGSRRITALGTVSELRSDLRSHYRQAIVGFEYQLRRPLSLSATNSFASRFSGTLKGSYTNASGRTQTTGYSSLTAGDPRLKEWEPSATPRHTFQAMFVGELEGWFSFGTSMRFSSGIRYTPQVANDINGDGYANDRAFIFDPSLPTNASVAMRGLISSAPTSARDCLTRQSGQIADANSCIGPWSSSLGTLSLTFDSYRIGLGNRGSLTLLVNNALGGLDRLLHRGNRLHHWGEGAYPDPVLLRVRGFDATREQFIYTVNPSFGAIGANRFVSRQPVQLTIDFRAEVGSDRETRVIEEVMHYARTHDLAGSDSALVQFLTTSAHPRASADISQILRASDSLQLSSDQVSALNDARVQSRARSDSIYTDLAHYLWAQDGRYGTPHVRSVWHDAIAKSIRAASGTLGDVRAVLSAQQLAWLHAHGLAANLFRPPEQLERVLRAPLLYVR